MDAHECINSMYSFKDAKKHNKTGLNEDKRHKNPTFLCLNKKVDHKFLVSSMCLQVKFFLP